MPAALRASLSRAKSPPVATTSTPHCGASPRFRVLVALGQIAHVAAARALGLPPVATKFGHGAQAVAPDGRILLSSYHCSSLQPEHRQARIAQMFEGLCLARALDSEPVA